MHLFPIKVLAAVLLVRMGDIAKGRKAMTTSPAIVPWDGKARCVKQVSAAIQLSIIASYYTTRDK